jgi:hypothetical protein
MINLWTTFQNSRARWRIPAKCLILSVVVLFVCYPNPILLIRNLERWHDPNALIQPDAPALDPWHAEIKVALEGIETGPAALKIVQRFVYQKIPYAFDWETWGAVDYFPTVTEAVEMGREDCDGQAVVAASMLRRMGYQADLVTNGMHVWVKTDHGETMSPGKGPIIAQATDDGLQVQWRAMIRLPRDAGSGLALFPLGRELIVLATICLLTLRTGMNRTWFLICVLITVDGFIIFRHGSSMQWTRDKGGGFGQLFGLANMGLGLLSLHVMQFRSRRISSANSTQPIE